MSAADALLPARDTIFARSSGAGRAGVAVFRISGPRAGEVLDAFCGGRGQARRARLARVTLPDGSLLDHGLALWFPGPASFTGEDVAELHLHGSPAVERAFTDAMLDFGLAPATAGAFTMRAFAAGKLDLAQAEGLGDLLTAETEAQRRQALGQLGGAISARAEDWRAAILSALAALEAAVDFPDEDDVPDGVASQALAPLRALHADMRAAIAGADGAARIREGATIVITGPPNAGKSSLLNRLAGSERAIVSDEAGTTRDVLEVRMSLGGQLVTLIDTAGLREESEAGAIERDGIARARRAAETADLCLEVRDGREVDRTAEAGGSAIWIANKADLTDEPVPDGWLAVSAVTGWGVDALLDRMTARIVMSGEGVLTRGRHVALVRRAAGQVETVMASAMPPEIAAEALRIALRDLEELTGRIAPDDVLGEVFAGFCIGK